MGRGYFNWYPAQAKNKEEVIQAMKWKHDELRREMAFFDEGLKKIAGLKEKDFYKLRRNNEGEREMHLFVQCWKFGRDHVEFRVFARDYEELDLHIEEAVSYAWNWDWESKPVDPKDAVMYVSWPFKTKYFEKLLKGKYKCQSSTTQIDQP
jgi:hypothetical protein